MYRVAIVNDGVRDVIHYETEKLTSGKIVKGINAIDSFSFSILPSNIGFDKLHDYKTLVNVYNTTKQRYEFYGRVLYSDTTMNDKGLITKDVVCESYFGFLCDSEQNYIAEKNWTVTGLLKHMIDVHNSQVEDYKRFYIGEVTVTDPNDNLYCGIQRKNTWEAIKEKLINALGGEIRFRVSGNKTYIDYLTEIGETSETEIALSRNMKSVSRERDPSEIVTRLVPLGAKLKDAEGNDTETRLDISSVNDGLIYIEDAAAMERYGIRYKTVEFDDITVAANLLTRGDEWLKANNKIRVKYTVTALDLSLLGLELDDFEVHNYYPIKNALIGIDDTARVIKKNIDIIEEIKSSFEIGENFETLSDIQVRQSEKIKQIEETYAQTAEELENEISEISETEKELAEELEEQKTVIAKLERNDESILAQVENAAGDITKLEISLDSIEASVTKNEDNIAALTMTVNQIKASVSNGVTSAELALTIGDDGVARISASADEIELTGNRVSISSNYFNLTRNGGLTCNYASIYNAEVTGTFKHTSGDSTVTIDSGYVSIKNGGAFLNMGAATTSMGETRGYIRGGTSTGNGLYFYENGIYLNGSAYANAPIATTSDANKKHSITDLSERYSSLFDNLTPRLYKYNDGTSDRVHVGFIAQEVEEAITAAGLSSKEFAGFVKATGVNEETGAKEELYCIRYEEFIALCVGEIQQLKQEVKELKANG